MISYHPCPPLSVIYMGNYITWYIRISFLSNDVCFDTNYLYNNKSFKQPAYILLGENMTEATLCIDFSYQIVTHT